MSPSGRSPALLLAALLPLPGRNRSEISPLKATRSDDEHSIPHGPLIAAAAIATYLTRFGGYLLITRMTRIPPRMEAALNAVPAAVLTTLVAPAFFNGGTDIKVALAIALVVGLRFSHDGDVGRRLGRRHGLAASERC